MSILESITTGIEHKPQRVLLYGVEGIGKTELAAQFPNPIFLAAEDGTSHIDTARYKPDTWPQTIEFLAELLAVENLQYQTLCIDTVKWVEQLCDKFLCEREGLATLGDLGFGKGTRLLYNEFQVFMKWISALYARRNMNIVVIGHAGVKGFNNPEGDNYDRYSLQMSVRELAEEVKQWCDDLGFTNYDTRIEESKNGMQTEKQAKSLNRRILHLTRTVAFDAKNRYHLPSMIDCGGSPAAAYAKYMAEFNQWPTRHEQMLAQAA